MDFEKAYTWFLRAYIMSAHNQPEACFKLGDCYRYGRGVSADAMLARRLYEEAYSSSHGYMVEDLGFRKIRHGWDVRLLAADAAARLGDCWREGIGCRKDLESARRYYRVAIAGFERKIQLRDEFAPGLLESVQRRLAQCV